MNNPQLHAAQAAILYALRHVQSARFSMLMRQTGMDSDLFKFHLKKMQKLGYITKTGDGRYSLSPYGKEFSNNLDDVAFTSQKLPKLSLLIVASQRSNDGEDLYLFQERMRNPYWGFWSFIGGPICWGQTPEAAAAHELKKQTGLSAAFTVRAFLRKRDYAKETNELLEDKQFVVLEASELKGELSSAWKGGHNEWLSLSDFKSKEKYFVDSLDILAMLQANTTYGSVETHYLESEY